MTTCDNPEHANLEAELNDALEEVLQMEERLAAYEASGVSLDDPQDDVVAAARAEDLAALQERVGILEKERDAYEQDYLNQKDRVNELEAQIEDNDRKTKDLERLRRKLEEDIDYTRKLLQTEKAKAADAQKRAGGADRTRRSEQREQIALLQELQELRERAEELEAQVGERDEMLEALVLSNQSQLKRNETLTVQNEDLRGEFNEATQMLEEKARELLECQEQLEIAKEAEEEQGTRLEGALTESRRRAQELEEELRVEKGVVFQLKEQVAGSESGGGTAARQELERFRSEVERLGRELGSQSSLFAQAALDLEVLTTELETERQKNRDLVHEIQTAEVHKVKGLEAKLRNLTGELEAERQRYGELEDSKAKLEKDLAEAEDWKSRYEQGHGLEEVVRFQKQLKNDISRLEAELEDRTVKLGEAMDANEVLSLTCQRLKQEAGRPEDFEFDDLPAVKKAQADEVKRLTAVSIELQEQVDDLNDERVRLLRKLRDRAAGSVAVVAGIGSGGLADHEGEGARVRTTGRGQGVGSFEEGGEKPMQARAADEAFLSGAVTSESAAGPGIAARPSPSSTRQPGEKALEFENGSPEGELASAARDTSHSGAGASPGEGDVDDRELPMPVVGGGEAGAVDPTDPSGRDAAIVISNPAAEEGEGRGDDGAETQERRSTPIPTSSGKGEIGCVDQAHDGRGGGAGVAEARNGVNPRGCVPTGGSSASRQDGTGGADGTVVSLSDLGAKRRQVGKRDDKVEQLTRINETLMRQLHELMAKREENGSSPRDHWGRRSSRGGEGTRAPRPQVPLNSEMQRLLTEMGNLREMIALGIDSKAPRGSSAAGDNESRGQQGLPSLSRTDPGAPSGGVAQQGTEIPSPVCDSETPPDKASGSPSRTRIEESQPSKEKDEVLRRQFRRLNLLPEQWATGVRDMNLRLVEALEQLRSQEEELDEHEKLVARYEAQISDMRAQAAALYREQEGKEKAMEERRKAFAEEAEGLREERDTLAVRVRRLEEVLAVEDKAVEDPSALNGALRELSRKVTVYEVNEAVMARRYASLKEQLQLESEARAVCEKDLMEMSAMTKTRLLYLEQWKAGASARLTRLHRRMAASVPEHELICTRRELEDLQEEYLGLLQSCAEARVQVVEMAELSARIQRLDGELAEAKVEIAVFGEQLSQAEVRVHKAEGLAKTAEIEAGNQVKAAAGGATQADFSALLAEVQKHQGECSKAEVERAAAARRSEIAERRLSSVEIECRAAKEKATSLESREREARLKAQAASAELVKVQNRFEGGLTREEVRALRERLDVETERAQAAALDAERLKEVADIASEQAMTMANQRKDAEAEIAELRQAVADLESRSDDDRLIGQLQRKLTATKMTYRALARKHEMTKADLRRKVTQLRVLEMRMDKRGDALYDLHERSREKVAALREALVAFTEGRAGGVVTGADGAAGPERGLGITRARELAAKIAALTAALETSERALREAGEARRDAEMKAEAAEVSRRSQEALVGDLKLILLSGGSKIAPAGSSTGIIASEVAAEREEVDVGEDGPTRSLGTVGGSIAGMALSSAPTPAPTARDMARRVVFLSEELCAAKLEASELRRNVASLREDKEYMQRRVANVESSSRALEVAKAEAETRAVLACGEVDRGFTDVDAGGPSVSFSGDVGDGDSRPTRVRMDPRSLSRVTAGGCDEAAGGELSEEERRLLEIATPPAEVDFGDLDPEEALRRLQGAQAKVASLTRALVGAREEKNAALARVEGAEQLSRDLQLMLRFYEKQAAQNGLPRLDDRKGVSDKIGDGPRPRGGGLESNAGDGGAENPGAQGLRVRPRNGDLERDRASMQEAANTTMASMKRLLDEKNAAIERLKRKLEDARTAGREAASADRSEAARLTDRIYRENEDSLGQLRVALRQLGTAEGLGGGNMAMNNRLMTQLEEVSGLLGEKDETIRQLELKLRTASNQRERAEERCGEALEENERMRADLSTLASQLQQAEERCLAAMEDRSSAKRLAELRKALLAKEKKMRELREAVVKLKQEFAQAEVDREAAAAEADWERSRKSDDRSKGLEGKVKKLREQLGALQEGMARAARDLEQEKKEREELTKSHDKALKENRRLRDETRKTQERAASLEATLADTRRDLDSGKEEGQRLRALSKPSLVSPKKTHRKRRREGEGGKRHGEGKESFASDSDGEGDDSKEAGADRREGKSSEGPPDDGDREHGGAGATRAGLHRRIGELEKRIQVLTAQNAALRSIVPPTSPGPGNDSSDKITASRKIIPGPGRRLGTAGDYRGEEGLARPRVDREIGSGPCGNNPTEEHRAASSAPAGTITSNQGSLRGQVRDDRATHDQLQGHREAAHRAWESEKKLRKRVETLERRLDERGVELRAAESQITQIRDLLTRANKEKETAIKRLNEGGQGNPAKKGRVTSAGGLLQAEEARARVFELEQENASLRRAVEVDLPAEIDSLKHQIRALGEQLEESETRRQEQERKAEVMTARALRKSSGGGVVGEGSLREEEALFHDLEAVRDELSAEKVARRDLEAQLLERDAANVELRFDLEARAAETERLQRRAKELQLVIKASSISGGVGKGPGQRTSGSRLKRERDLEEVVEALKRVTEKLRAENERLRKSAAEGAGRAEAERAARGAKKDAVALREEMERLRSRVRQADDSVHRLAQKQELVNQLRRKLKTKEEDLRSCQDTRDELAETKTRLVAELDEANGRLAATADSERLRMSSSPTPSAVVEARDETNALREQVEDQADLIDHLREQLAAASTTAAFTAPVELDDVDQDPALDERSDEVAEAIAAAKAAQAEADQLRRRLAENERELQRMERRATAAAAIGTKEDQDASKAGDSSVHPRGGSGDDVPREVEAERLEAENLHLKEENEKLLGELQAFDLDFFEEIEDLKYKYSEAVKKLRRYEGGNTG